MNLYLIGYRGAGKSVVARLVAAKLGWPLVRVDEQIQKMAGKSIAEIFEHDGEESFRDLESKQIAAYGKLQQHVIDLGGGAVVRPENRTILSDSGQIVWLRASAEVLWDRMNRDQQSQTTRPNLTSQGGLAEVESVLAARQPIYAELSDFSLDTDTLQPEQVAEQIVQWLRNVDNKNDLGSP